MRRNGVALSNRMPQRRLRVRKSQFHAQPKRVHRVRAPRHRLRRPVAGPAPHRCGNVRPNRLEASRIPLRLHRPPPLRFDRHDPVHRMGSFRNEKGRTGKRRVAKGDGPALGARPGVGPVDRPMGDRASDAGPRRIHRHAGRRHYGGNGRRRELRRVGQTRRGEGARQNRRLCVPWEGYGRTLPIAATARSGGAVGAAALLVRGAGPLGHRTPHTGMMRYQTAWRISRPQASQPKMPGCCSAFTGPARQPGSG